MDKKKCSTFSLLIIILLSSHIAQAVESTNKEIVEKRKKPEVSSIDVLVIAYQKASEKDAYKIMNQIKEQITEMTQQRQIHAITKAQNISETDTISTKRKNILLDK